MKSYLLFFSLLFFLSSCAYNPQDPNIIRVEYQPMQCVEEPWNVWYEKENLEFGTEPTQEEVIKLYYGNEFNTELDLVFSVPNANIACNGCGICPKEKSYIARIHNSTLEVMLETGWLEVDLLR